MQFEEVRDALVDVLINIQLISGRSIPDIDEYTHPIGDLDGFDSLNAVEAGILLSEALGREIDFELLLSPSHGNSPTVSDIANRIINSFENQEGVFHEQLRFQNGSRYYRK